MAENLFSPDQRITSDAYREGWDRVFGKAKLDPSHNIEGADECTQCIWGTQDGECYAVQSQCPMMKPKEN